MNQWQYETIIKIIQEGAPALSDNLCTALSNVVKERNFLIEENATLKASTAELAEESEDSVEE